MDRQYSMTINDGTHTYNIPYSATLTKSVEKNVKTFTRQSGSEVDIVIYRRLTVSVATRCMWDLVQKIESCQLSDSLTVNIPYVTTTGSRSYTMRITDFNYSLVPKSQKLTEIDGLYDLSFTLREF